MNERDYSLPAETTRLEISGASLFNFVHPYPIEDNKALYRMLELWPNKIDSITVDYHGDEYPGFLRIFVMAFTKAKCLTLKSLCGRSDALFASLLTCFLLHNDDGPRELILQAEQHDILPLHQAKLLLEGVAISTSLEKLHLYGDFSGDHEELASILTNALHRNQSVKDLTLSMDGLMEGTTLQTVFQTVAMDGNIQDLTMRPVHNMFDNVGILPFDVIADSLFRDDCSLKSLYLSAIEPSRKADSNMVAAEEGLCALNKQNTTVIAYGLESTRFDCSRIMETGGLFKSIQKLSLLLNKQISDISPLDPLLIGSNATLRDLDLTNCNIGLADAIVFFRKLPQMTTLRQVLLRRNPFLYESEDDWADVAVDAVLRNQSLEFIDCECDYDNLVPEDYEWAAEPSDFHKRTAFRLTMNREYHRVLEVASKTKIPANLRPHILARTACISDCSKVWDDDEDANDYNNMYWVVPDETARADVLFRLLKEHVTGQW